MPKTTDNLIILTALADNNSDNLRISSDQWSLYWLPFQKRVDINQKLLGEIKLDPFDAFIWTSKQTVYACLDTWGEEKFRKEIAKRKSFCVGHETKKLVEATGGDDVFAPLRGMGQVALAETIKRFSSAKKMHFFYPHSDQADPYLESELEKYVLEIVSIDVYSLELNFEMIEQTDAYARASKVTWIILSSPSAIRAAGFDNLHKWKKDYGVKFAVIGDTTRNAFKAALSIEPDLCAQTSQHQSLIDMIIRARRSDAD